MLSTDARNLLRRALKTYGGKATIMVADKKVVIGPIGATEIDFERDYVTNQGAIDELKKTMAHDRSIPFGTMTVTSVHFKSVDPKRRRQVVDLDD